MSTTATTLRAYKAIENKFGSDVASEVLQAIDDKVEEQLATERAINKSELATKEDIHLLRDEINKRFANQNKWFLTFAITIFALLLSIIGILFSFYIKS